MVSSSTLLLPLILFSLSESAEVRVRRDLLSDILDGFGRVRGGRPPPRRPQAAPGRPRRPPGRPRQPPRFSPPRNPNSQPGSPRRPQNNPPGPSRSPQNNRLRPSRRPQSKSPPGPPRAPTKLIFVDQPLRVEPLPPVFQPESPPIKNIPSSSFEIVTQIPSVGHHISTTSRTILKDINTTRPPSTQTFSSFRTPSGGNEVELSNFSSLPFLESIPPASQGFTPELSSPFSSFPRKSGGTSSPTFSSPGPSSSSFSSSTFPGAAASSAPGSSVPAVSLPASSTFVNLPSQNLQFEQKPSTTQDFQIQRQVPEQEIQFQPPASESTSTFFSSNLVNLPAPSTTGFDLSQTSHVENSISSAGIPALKQEFGDPVGHTEDLVPKSSPAPSCRFCRVRSCFAQCR